MASQCPLGTFIKTTQNSHVSVLLGCFKLFAQHFIGFVTILLEFPSLYVTKVLSEIF